MTPIAKTALLQAVIAATTLPARITNSVIHAAHKSHRDGTRAEHLKEAAAKARQLLGAIMLAQQALEQQPAHEAREP